jgi:hypothetical protein
LVVGVARFTLALGQAHSLKDKRQVVRKVVDRVRARFLVAIAEVADHDLWQKATLGISAVGADHAHVRAQVEEVLRAVEELYVAPMVARDIQVDTYDDFEPDDFGAGAAPAGGPDAFTRELLAGDPGEEPDDSGPEDAPWAAPPPPRPRPR